MMLRTLYSRTKRNHGLEHATLNLLHERFPYHSFAGHSDPLGFWIVGQISAPELTEIAQEALEELRDGNRNLAMHSNCGTNLLTSGMMAGLAGLLGLIGTGGDRRRTLRRLPLVITLSTLALIVSRPLGLHFQKEYTTSSEPGSLQITRVTTHQQGQFTAHRIQTRD